MLHGHVVQSQIHVVSPYWSAHQSSHSVEEPCSVSHRGLQDEDQRAAEHISAARETQRGRGRDGNPNLRHVYTATHRCEGDRTRHFSVTLPHPSHRTSVHCPAGFELYMSYPISISSQLSPASRRHIAFALQGPGRGRIWDWSLYSSGSCGPTCSRDGARTATTSRSASAVSLYRTCVRGRLLLSTASLSCHFVQARLVNYSEKQYQQIKCANCLHTWSLLCMYKDHHQTLI